MLEFFPGFTLRMAWLPPEYTHGCWIELVDWKSPPPFVKEKQ